MNRIFFIATILIFSISIGISSAGEKTCIDNFDIQEYKGQTGKWILIESKGKLFFYLKKFHVTLKQVKNINGKNFSYGNYLFIPYSEKYLAELKEMGITRTVINSSDSEYIWPISIVGRITSAFGIRWGQFHTGVDLPANQGTPVVAAMDGRVVSAEYTGGHGNSLLIEHRNNLYSRYSHNSVLLVKRGEFVKKGQIIAFVGCTGNSTGNHLHFEVRYKDIPLNPLDFLPIKEHLDKPHFFKSNLK